MVLVSKSDTDKPWGPLAVLLTGQFMANVDTAIVNTAVPSIRAGFESSASELVLVVSGYLIAYAVLLVTGARLGASRGYRRTFLFGLAVFTVASLACGLAPGITVLIVARFAQGIGAALVVPQVLSGIQVHFTGHRRVRALGYYAIALSAGAVLGQVLGGVLISADLFGMGWRPIFLINVPVGVVLIAAARRVLPADDVGSGGADGMDLRGVAVLSTAVLLVIVPLVFGGELGWPLWSVLSFAAGGLAFGCFVRVERGVSARGGRPLLAMGVLRATAVRFGLIAHGLTTMTYLALLFVLALYLQQGLGFSPAYSGLAMVSWVAAFGLAGPLLPRVPARYLALAPVVGCLVLAIGYAAVATFLATGGHAGPLLFPLLGIGGLGLGISSNSLINAMTTALPDRYAADLSGVISTNAQLAGALGVALANTGYLGVQTGLGIGPTDAFALVLAAFTLLGVLASVAATRLRTAR